MATHVRDWIAYSGIAGGTLWLFYRFIRIDSLPPVETGNFLLSITFVLFLLAFAGVPMLLLQRDNWWGWIGSAPAFAGLLLLILYFNASALEQVQEPLSPRAIASWSHFVPGYAPPEPLPGRVINRMGSWSVLVLGFNLLGAGLLLTGCSLVTTIPESRGIPVIALGLVSLFLIYTVTTSTSAFQGTLITLSELLFGAGWLWLGLVLKTSQ
jgi:hypothetical protein